MFAVMEPVIGQEGFTSGPEFWCHQHGLAFTVRQYKQLKEMHLKNFEEEKKEIKRLQMWYHNIGPMHLIKLSSECTYAEG